MAHHGRELRNIFPHTLRIENINQKKETTMISIDLSVCPIKKHPGSRPHVMHKPWPVDLSKFEVFTDGISYILTCIKKNIKKHYQEIMYCSVQIINISCNMIQHINTIYCRLEKWHTVYKVYIIYYNIFQLCQFVDKSSDSLV